MNKIMTEVAVLDYIQQATKWPAIYEKFKISLSGFLQYST